MTIAFNIQYFPVFEPGIFAREPALFDHFYGSYLASFMNNPSSKPQEILSEYEGKTTWPLVVGPGFNGANHPGTEKTFNAIMMDPTGSVSNGDCLYVNPSQKVFAISDAPDMSICSRKLLTKLDDHLRETSTDDMEIIVNQLNREIMTSDFDGATMTLVTLNKTGKARAFIAGDTYLFYGNILKEKMASISGVPEFMGRTNEHIRAKYFDIKKGDFFIIASDGIMSLWSNRPEAKLDEILWTYIDGDSESCAFRTIEDCNRIAEENINNQKITRFGGYDNVSVLFIFPEKLIDSGDTESVILGGYIMNLKSLIGEEKDE